jgi:hypothetical protein
MTSEAMMRPRVVVRPAAAVLACLLAAAGLVAYGIHFAAAELGAVTRSPLDPAVFVALFALGYLALALMHELGHACMYLALGMRWERLMIGQTLSVRSPTPRTFRAQLLISAAGPALQAAAGLVLLSITSSVWTLVGLLGALALADCLLNFLIPLGKNTDAYKVYRCFWAIIRGRGRRLI